MNKLSLLFLCGLFANQAFAGNKDSAQYHMNLGQQAEGARRYSAAWQHYERASKFDADNPDIYLAIANTCTQMNRMAPALDATERAAALQPGNINLQTRLMDMYYQYSQWDKVIAMGSKLGNAKMMPSGVSYKMGKAYYHKQDYGKSLTYLKAAIREDDRNSEAHYLTGRMLLNMGNYDQAIPYYKRALDLDPNNAMHQYEMAMLLSTNYQDRDAIPYFQKALDLGYNAKDDFYLNMAYAYAGAKMVDEGAKLFNDLIAKRPQDMRLVDALANTYYAAGKYKMAVATWDRILAQNPNDARAIYHIGLAYIKSGRESDGKAMCERAIGIDPSLAILRQKQMM